MTRFSILLAALIFLWQGLNARTIQGVVISSEDDNTLPGATCKLMSQGKLIVGTATDDKGEFSLNTDLKSSLVLEISMVGYASASIIIESGEKNLNVGTVSLEAGIELNELTVTANSVINKGGKTIVYPSSSDVKASSTSISLFQKLPLAGLQANPINRSISVDGGSPVIIIDGVPSTLDDLNSLQPKDIEKIEYSRQTPIRYADKGNSGYINVTLKKRNDGGTVFVWGRSAVATGFADGNLRGSYHQGPSQFTLFYSPSWRNYKEVFDNTSESYIGNDFLVELEEHDRNPFNYIYQQVRLKYDYSPNTHTLFSATFAATPFKNKNRVLGQTHDSELGDYDIDNLTRSKEFSPSLDLFFRKDFNESNSLEVQMVGTLNSSDYRRDNTYLFADGGDQSYIMNVDSRRRSLISEISYIHSFSANTQLSAGYQNTVSYSKNSYLNSDYKPVLSENNNYLYARLGQNIGKVFISLATGAKLFWIENDINKRHFIRNVSTAQITWNINQSWNLQGSFQYTPIIPSLSALTDYPQQTSPYLISNGNPDLKVAENFNYRLQAGYTYKKFSATFLSQINNTRNDVISDMIYLGDGLFLSQSINARKRRTFSNSLSFTLSGVQGFGANLNLGLNHYETAGEGWEYKLTSFDGSISVWWNKGPVTISYWRNLPGTYLYGHFKGKDENGDAIQVEYQPDKHWTIGASWMYMFDKKGTKYPSWNFSPVNPYYRERYIRNNGNMIVLSLSYTADFGSIFRTAGRSLNNADNSSSILKM